MLGDKGGHEDQAQAVNEEGRKADIQVRANDPLGNPFSERGFQPAGPEFFPLTGVMIGEAFHSRRTQVQVNLEILGMFENQRNFPAEKLFHLPVDVPIGGDFLPDALPEPVNSQVADVEEEFVFALEVIVQGPLGNSRPPGDLIHLRPVKSPLGEEIRGGGQHAFLFIPG